MPIRETDIRRWADRHDCRTVLPILVRRLVRETTPGLRSLRFPGNEAVDLAGLDGEVEDGTATKWVPAGRSIWEMGCNEDPCGKASGDFGKRTAEIPEKERKGSSFVFVTPRRWPRKGAWLAERRREGAWAAVCAYDAIDLETWLEEAPITDRWLGERLEIAHPGLLTPDEWWKRWSSASTPPITRRLVATRRHNEAETLMQKLRQAEPVVTVLADDRSEAAAFVIAALGEAGAVDLLDRVVIVTADNIRVPRAGNSRPIVIVDLPEEQEPDFGDRQDLTILRLYPRGRVDSEGAIQLSHVPSSAFREELEAMGFSRDEADSQAVRVGHSIPVLRRRLSPDPAVRRPAWARDRNSAKRMLPFALAGSWVERKDQDDITVLALLADWTEDEIKAFRDDLLLLDDAPIARYGNANVAVSQLDALFAIGPYLTVDDLDRFYQLLPDLLAERDPALDLPEDQRWMANVLGKGRRYSGALLSGLKDALCILAIHGRQICGERLGIDLAYRANAVVRTLMTDANEDHWLTIRRHLRSLAEAAPHSFLTCLEAELRQERPPIQAIMGTTGGALGTGECLRTDLLWALETLAWDSAHFARVAEIVFFLQRLHTDDNWGNSPSAMAASLFRAWWPGTALTVEGRLAVLRRLAQAHRLPVIDVCISLLPAVGSRFGLRTLRPRWRVSDEQIRDGTDQDFREAAIEASHLLLDMAPFGTDELKRALDALAGLHPDDVTRLVAEAERWSATASDGERAKISEAFRKKHTYRRIGKKDDDLLIPMERIAAALVPHSAMERHRWLFQNHHVEWRELVEAEMEEHLPFEERIALVRRTRADALREIEREIGREALLSFALGVEHPDTVADALLADEAGSDVAAEWIARALRSGAAEASEPFLKRLLFGVPPANLDDTVHLLEEQGVLNDPQFLRRLATALPGDVRGWEIAASLGEEAEEVYWNTAHIWIADDTTDDQVEHVVTRLLEARRPRAALTAARHQPVKLRPELWERVLKDTARIEEAGKPQLSAYELDGILAHLDAAPGFTDERMAQIELPFVPLLCPRGLRNSRRVLALHREMARDPAGFVQLLQWRYRRHDGELEPEFEKLNDEQRSRMASIASDLLEGWNTIPGMNADGEIDERLFRTWVEEALRLAAEVDRLRVAGIPIAALLGRLARRRSWNDWLPEPVLDLLERPEHEGLRERLPIAVYNARGMTSRSPYDGGAQERRLTENYRRLAVRYGNSHPRMAATLSEIVSYYEADAKRHDEDAVLDERFRS